MPSVVSRPAVSRRLVRDMRNVPLLRVQSMAHPFVFLELRNSTPPTDREGRSNLIRPMGAPDGSRRNVTPIPYNVYGERICGDFIALPRPIAAARCDGPDGRRRLRTKSGGLPGGGGRRPEMVSWMRPACSGRSRRVPGRPQTSPECTALPLWRIGVSEKWRYRWVFGERDQNASGGVFTQPSVT